MSVNHQITVVSKKVGGISVVSLGRPVVSLSPIVRGLQGPAGPAGQDGRDGIDGIGGTGHQSARYEHTQSVAASTWTVNHNLGYLPLVQALSVGGMALLAEVLHTSANQALILFDLPTAGLALCS